LDLDVFVLETDQQVDYAINVMHNYNTIPSKNESLLDEGSKKDRGVEVEEGGQEDSISQIFWLLFTT
jgi:ureidoglycolate hydrolase